MLQQLRGNHEQSSRFLTVQFVVERLLAQPHEANLSQVAADSGRSARQVQKLFEEFVGVPPKQWLKIVRLQRSFVRLHQRSGSLTAVAYECGYFDQSHFIRDFKSFTGLTPSAYVPAAFPLNGLFA